MTPPSPPPPGAFPYATPQAFGAALAAGLRVPTEAWLGHRMFERFGVDLVTGVVITGQIETMPPLLSLDIPGLPQPSYRLYPLVDSVADKVMAIVEPRLGQPSTRFRDLVDLVLVAHSQCMDANGLAIALASERSRRSLPDITELRVPDEQLWRAGYATAAKDVPGFAEKQLREALPLVKTFIDPVLTEGVRDHTWDPTRLAWH